MVGNSYSFWNKDIKLTSTISNPCCCPNDNSNSESLLVTKENGLNELPDKINFKVRPKNKIFKTFKDTISDTLSIPIEKKKYNDWTHEEDLLLIQLYNSGLNKRWKKIASIIGNKTSRMCGYRIKKLEKLFQQKNEGTRIYEIKNKKKDLITIRDENENIILREIKENKRIKKIHKRRKLIKVKIIFY